MARKKPEVTPAAVALAEQVARLKRQASDLFASLDRNTSDLLKLVGSDNPVTLATGEKVVISDTWDGKAKVWKQVPFDRYVVAVQAAPV